MCRYIIETKSNKNNHRDILMRSIWDILQCDLITKSNVFENFLQLKEHDEDDQENECIS